LDLGNRGNPKFERCVGQMMVRTAPGTGAVSGEPSGKVMTKSGLIETVAEATPHISKRDTEIVVNTIFESMAQALKTGERIEIRGFGSFQVKIREAREGRNPKTGAPVHISAKRTPFFKVGKELKEMVDGHGSGEAYTSEIDFDPDDDSA
jgi:integration host factor beta subunit